MRFFNQDIQMENDMLVPYNIVIKARNQIRKRLSWDMGKAGAERVNNIVLGLQNEELTYREALDYIYDSLTPSEVHEGIEKEERRAGVSIAILGTWWIITRTGE